MRKGINILLVLAIILGGLEFLLYKRVVTLRHPEQKDEKVEPKDLLLNANDVQFSSDTGDLHGWLILGKPGSQISTSKAISFFFSIFVAMGKVVRPARSDIWRQMMWIPR